MRNGDENEGMSHALKAQAIFRFIKDRLGLAETYLLMAVMRGKEDAIPFDLEQKQVHDKTPKMGV